MDRLRESGAAVALVEQARAGDRAATAELIGAHLPLVYNVVGRALSGHADTDDVVQETMLRAVDGLSGLRDPRGFRSWLVAIAMNQIRRRHRDSSPIAPVGGPGEGWEVPDPAADFVGLTIVRLGLTEQRREVAEATRWLDEGDRELLALWWQEAAGELTRAELAAALEVSPQHAAVRVQRMKGQLEAARVVVRALSVEPCCPVLAELTAGWDGVPGTLWRKRIARHAKECLACSRHREGLVPAEGLLAGLAMVPLPHGFHLKALGATVPPAHGGGSHTPGHGGSSHTPGRPGGSHRRGGRRRAAKSAARRPAVVLGAAGVTVVAAGLLWTGLPGSAPHSQAAPAQVEIPGAVSGSPAVSPPVAVPVADTPSAAAPTPTPSPTTASPTPRAATPQQAVLDLVNAQRARNGCKPVKADAKLQAAAQAHSDDMAARNFFDHTNPDGVDPQGRIEAAGYRWSTWGENIAMGQPDPASVMDSWMNSPGHRANILNCAFTELGVGVHTGGHGPWWTQDFGAPA